MEAKTFKVGNVGNEVTSTLILHRSCLYPVCPEIQLSQPDGDNRSSSTSPFYPSPSLRSRSVTTLPPSSNDFTLILSSFLNDFKAMTTPLITTLTTVMTQLIPILTQKWPSVPMTSQFCYRTPNKWPNTGMNSTYTCTQT